MLRAEALERRELRFEVDAEIGAVSAVLLRRPAARSLFVLAHGAGAGMRHTFLEALADALAVREVATLRFQFPYTEAGGRRPDPAPRLQRTIRAAVARARLEAGDLLLFAGGKSMGGRMTSLAASQAPLEGVHGLCFVGFPLHAAAGTGLERAQHLSRVELPMLFLQGTRDRLASLPEIRQVCGELGERARLHLVEGGEHSFRVPRRSGRTDADVIGELADVIAGWADRLG